MTNLVHKPQRNTPERAEMLRLRRLEQLARGSLAYKEENSNNHVNSRSYYRSAIKALKNNEAN
jgi:hypothetical protein